LESRAAMQKSAQSPVSQPVIASPVVADSSRSLLSLITSSGEPGSSSLVGIEKPSSVSLESQKISGSRFFPNPLHGDPSIVPQKLEKLHAEVISSSPSSEYNPPQSSRLLALGSRTPSGSSAHSSKAQSSITSASISPDPQQHSIQQLNALQAQAQSELINPSPDIQFRLQTDSPFGVSQRPSSVRQQEQFSPFNHVGRGNPYEEKDLYIQQYDSHRRTSGVSSVSSESVTYTDLGNSNGGFIGNSGHASNFDLPVSGNQGGSYSSGKGSRFAKFFDNKGRDSAMAPITKPTGLSTPALQGHRQDLNRVHMENQGDNRTMEDIFAMLQSSAQVCASILTNIQLNNEVFYRVNESANHLN
jgi:zinc finger CCCH domain-containing protein 13